VELDLVPFRIAYYGADGQLLLAQNYDERTNVRMKLTVLPCGFSSVDGKRAAFHDTFTAEPDEHFYGFGEKFTDFDKRGQRIKTWNYDCGGVWSERSYKNVPFFVSTRKYGIFVDSAQPIDFDMVASNTASFSIICPDSALDYYVIAGPDLKTIVTKYATLTSFPVLPPKWSLGLWMSSGFQRDSASEVIQRAKLIREYDIPCDVLHLDCYWQRFEHWSELLWDKEMFPDPAEMITQIRDLGFKICLWINPYISIKSERFVEGSEKGYFLKNTEGETYVFDIWNGFQPPVGIIDMTHPDAIAWFKDLLQPHLRMGIDVFKTDFGEGIPADAIAYNGMDGATLHNIYALLYNDIVAEITAEETGHTGLVWARSSYAGGQRHPAQWGGDANCTFPAMASTLRGGLSMGMCGHAFWSHDVGGFTGHPTPELYTRWAQFGLFSPLTRAHGNTTRLPWLFGEQALRIFRDYVRLRYRLLPYIYTYACIAAETSLPLMRPMALEFPDDPNTYTMDLQYMFGEELLVAPIYNTSGRRSIYLPEGRWVDFWTHNVIAGPSIVNVQAAPDVLPLYVRANALIPTTEPTSFITETPFEQITFDAYLLEQGQFDLRDSDGTTHVSAAFSDSQLRISSEGAKRQLALRLFPCIDTTQIEAVFVNGQEIVYRQEAGDRQQQRMQNTQKVWGRAQDGTILVTWF
jgi:alpha-D-xyloside xylohydrolase